MRKAGDIIAEMTRLKGNLEGLNNLMDSLDTEELDNLVVFSNSLSKLCELKLMRRNLS